MDHAAGDRKQKLAAAVAVCAVALTLMVVPACSGKAHPPSVRYHGGAGKIPISTASEKAYRAYVQGRDLQEKLRHTDAREFFVEALDHDPDFAMAHLALAATLEGGEFLATLQRAVDRIDQVSPGERAMILAVQAGADGDPDGRMRHYETLVQLYPDDERAHTLLGGFHFARKNYDQAIDHYERAVELAPEFSQPYNQLGYAYRFRGEWVRAEKAFTRYIELIPEEPNPYDSYAEMLMKMGRFDESIAAYRKALSFDPEFVPSYVGIGNNQIFLERTDEARETFDRLHTVARTDGERRTAHLWTAVAHLHDGNLPIAVETLERRYRVAERTGDVRSMVDDLLLITDVQLEQGEADGAAETLRRAETLAGRLEREDDERGAFRDRGDYFAVRVAIARDDPQTARRLTDELLARLRDADAKRYAYPIRELRARVSIAEGDYESARELLDDVDDRDPRLLYLCAVACREAGHMERGQREIEQVANYNGIHLNLVHVRQRARQLLAEDG